MHKPYYQFVKVSLKAFSNKKKFKHPHTHTSKATSTGKNSYRMNSIFQ